MQRKNVRSKSIIKDASKKKIAIVVSDYYFEEVTGLMLKGAFSTLRECGVAEKNIHVTHVSGSFEIPYGCLVALRKKNIDAVITIGCIIKGETRHDEHIASAVSQSLMRLMERFGIPIVFGVLTVNDMRQAIARSKGENNKGIEVAIAALEMALL